MEVSPQDFKATMFDCAARTFTSKRPALVELYTDWCTSCKQLNPVLERLTTKYKEAIDVIKVNISTEDDIVSALDIQTVPTMLFIKPDRGLMKTMIGLQNSSAIESVVAECLL